MLYPVTVPVGENLAEQDPNLLLALKVQAAGLNEPGRLLKNWTCPVGVIAGLAPVTAAAQIVDKPNWNSDGKQDKLTWLFSGVADV